jgi:imidazolonepropionase-like amidohydrolase
MTIRPPTSALILLAAGLLACEPGAGKTAYVGAEIFDGTGAPLLLDGVILVDGQHIEAIGPADGLSIPRGATVVSVAGKWIIPGLIDAHAHPERWTMPAYLHYGVTSVRDMGTGADSVRALYDAVASGALAGPRVYLSGPMIDGAPPVWPGATAVSTPDEARRAIDRLALAEVSQAKLYTGIDRAMMNAALQEAMALQLPVAAHLGLVDAVTAAEFGLTSIEHLSGIVEATDPNAARYFAAHRRSFFEGWNLTSGSWHTLDSAGLQRTVDALVDAKVVLVPTLTLYETWSRLNDTSFRDRLDLSLVPPAVLDAWDVPDLIRRARLTETTFRALRRSRPYQNRFVRMFQRSGGTIATGTDSPNQLLAPGASMHDELQYLVRAGLLPREALLAATANAAHVLGTDSVGILRPGAVADFIVLNANPLEDIANTRTIQTVVVRGVAQHRTVETRQ